MSNADNRQQYSSYALYIPPGLPVPAKGRSWGGPRPVLEERPGPRWLDRREQNALLRAVERAGKPRDLAVVRLLLNTGLRVQELGALTCKDVTLSERKGLLTARHGKGGSIARCRLTTTPGPRCWSWAIRSTRARKPWSFKASVGR